MSFSTQVKLILSTLDDVKQDFSKLISSRPGKNETFANFDAHFALLVSKLLARLEVSYRER